MEVAVKAVKKWKTSLIDNVELIQAGTIVVLMYWQTSKNKICSTPRTQSMVKAISKKGDLHQWKYCLRVNLISHQNQPHQSRWKSYWAKEIITEEKRDSKIQTEHYLLEAHELLARHLPCLYLLPEGMLVVMACGIVGGYEEVRNQKESAPNQSAAASLSQKCSLHQRLV